MLFKIILYILITLNFAIAAESTIAPHFQLEDFSHTAIATDLEPDDVLAIKIIFEEASRLYMQNNLDKYPIDLVVVGEGNSAIKRMRMEKMLSDYFSIPAGVKVKVVEGKSTFDNIFPLDGEELFNPIELIAYQENNGEEAIHVLKQFVQEAPNPFIIQLKPAQELFALSLDPSLANKTTVLFYGSFNFRKTISDEDVLAHPYFESFRNSSYQLKLQKLLDQFTSTFLQMGIVESYGVLGDQSIVCDKYPWTQEIAQQIEISEDPFFASFRTLVVNWNHYLLVAELEYLKKTALSLNEKNKDDELNQIILALETNLDALINQWDTVLFAKTNTMISQLASQIDANILKKFETSMQFIELVNPDVGIEFTLSDVIVALVTSDHKQFFTPLPVHIEVNQNGYLESVEDEASNVFYYNRVDRQAFADLVLKSIF